MKYEKLTAEHIAVSASEYLPLYLREKTSIDLVESMVHGLVATVTTYMAGVPEERLQIYKRWPRDWWQAVKERWFPAWARRRWPVLYEEINIDRSIYKAVCPHLPEAPKGTHLQWMLQKRDEEAME